MCQTSLTSICYMYFLFLTCITCELNYVNKWWSIVAFWLICLHNSIRYRCWFCCSSVWQTHCHSESFSYDCPFKENVISEITGFTRYDFIRQRLNLFINRSLFISHFSYFSKYSMSDFLNSCFYSSHRYLPSLLKS